MGLSDRGAQLDGQASSRVRRLHADARLDIVRHFLVSVPREGRGEVRGSPRGLRSWTRDHSRHDHWTPPQSSHRLVRVVPRGTIPAQTPALRGRVLGVGWVIHAIMAPNVRVLAIGSALCGGHHAG